MNIRSITLSILVAIALILTGYISGLRHSKPQATSTDIKLTDTHTVQTETEIKKKDGTTQIVITTDTVQSIKDKSTITQDQPKYNISALVAEDLRHLNLGSPTYGVSITKQFIGPVNLGGFAFTNGLIGVSIGVSF